MLNPTNLCSHLHVTLQSNFKMVMMISMEDQHEDRPASADQDPVSIPVHGPQLGPVVRAVTTEVHSLTTTSSTTETTLSIVTSPFMAPLSSATTSPTATTPPAAPLPHMAPFFLLGDDQEENLDDNDDDHDLAENFLNPGDDQEALAMIRKKEISTLWN